MVSTIFRLLQDCSSLINVKLFLDSIVIINPLAAGSALLHLDQGEVEDFVENPGKWQVCCHFHLKLIRWKRVHGHLKVVKGYGGWVSIKNLPLTTRASKPLKLLRLISAV